MNDCRQRGLGKDKESRKEKLTGNLGVFQLFFFYGVQPFEAKVLRRLPNPHVASLRAKDACVRGVKHAYGLPQAKIFSLVAGIP